MTAAERPDAAPKDTLTPPVPQLDLLARFTVELTGEPWRLGRTSDLGERRIVPIAGGAVDPTRYYFRIQMSFETSSSHYDWLNRVIAVGSAIRLPHAVIYDAYAIR